MSNRVIPAEQLTQYQRWEMSPIFGAASTENGGGDAAVSTGAELSVADAVLTDAPVEEVVPVSYPTPEELEAVHQAAYDDGYQAGFSAGEADVTALKSQLENLLTQLEYQFSTMQVQLADDIVELAVRLAEQVLRQTLSDFPEKLAPIVQEAISSSPFLGTNPRILMHPDDVMLLQDRLSLGLPDGTKWQLVSDPAMSRGDCRLVAAEGEADLSLEIRWKRVLAALGR